MTELCTLAQVRARRQTAAGELLQDPLVEQVIQGVSAAIEREYKREFTPTDAATRTFELRADMDRVVLVPYEVRAVTLVTVDPDGDEPTDLAAGDFRLGPRPAEHGTHHLLQLRAGVVTIDETDWTSTLVDVTGDWGMEEIPADVVEAAILSTVHNMRTTVGQYSIANAAGGETRYERGDLPQAAQDLLEPYRRKGSHF